MTISLSNIGDINHALPGTNGRFCMTCHPIGNGWVLTPEDMQQRFQEQQQASEADLAADRSGDPVFRSNDGTVQPHADLSAPNAQARAYSLLNSRALIRVGLPVPADAEFGLMTVDDPYGFATSNELSLFRRTLPIANLKFETTLMWDGREPSLASQAADATTGHAQAATRPADDVVARMVGEENAVFFAQQTSNDAGDLTSDGALGGPDRLVGQSFTAGAVGSAPDPSSTATAFALFGAWASSSSPARTSIARGEELFNHRTFVVSSVGGFNDALGAQQVRATCATCHDAQNVGTSTIGLLCDLGVSVAARRSADVPLYTFANSSTGELRSVTDPGRGLITGKWSDLGRFKTPGLRGLAGHAPYFHDGSAATIADVVAYFNQRFQINLTVQEQTDLVAFLSVL
jgi:hypothetical protein